MSHPATATPTATTSTMMVASALMSGVTPSLTFEKISIGRVVAPGPAVKLEITRSSSYRVKASSQPEIIAGAMIGSVMSNITRNGVEPRSMAASSTEASMVVSRDCTITAT